MPSNPIHILRSSYLLCCHDMVILILDRVINTLIQKLIAKYSTKFKYRESLTRERYVQNLYSCNVKGKNRNKLMKVIMIN